MATSAQIRELLKTHCEGDDVRFFSVALQVAAAEARRGHDQIAKDIRNLVDRAKARRSLPKSDRIIHVSRSEGEVAERLEEVSNDTKVTNLVLKKVLSEISALFRMTSGRLSVGQGRLDRLFCHWASGGTNRWLTGA